MIGDQAGGGHGVAAAGTRRWAAARPELTKWLAWGAAAVALGTCAVMLAILVADSLPVFRHSGLGYLSGTRWFFRSREFGILPMIYGSAAVAVTGMAFAGTLGLGAAVFVAELMPARWRLAAKVLAELLAGVPSVVYGILGMLLLRPLVYRLCERWEPMSGDTLLTGGLLLGIMVVPTVMTLSEDALRGVPASQRHAARALGLNRTEAILAVSLPQALPGLVGALLLGFGRALGETIAVFLVVGRQDNQWPQHLLSLAPLLGAGQTLTSKLGGSETVIAYGDRLHRAAITGLALVLLLGVMLVTLGGAALRRRAGRNA